MVLLALLPFLAQPGNGEVPVRPHLPLHLTQIAFGGLVLGGIVTFAIVSIDHVKLRALRRGLVRDGKILDAPR